MSKIAPSQRPRLFARAPRRPLVTALTGMAALVLTAVAAVAQPATEGLQPPIPSPPLTAPSHPLQLAVAILLLALVIGANMIPSKRGHQD